MRSFTHPIRIYYEDTDAESVVYYANYLKFAERGRTEALREIGIEQEHFRKETGLIFVVRNVTMDLKAPARLDDEVTVTTTAKNIKATSLTMEQSIMRGETTLCQLDIVIVCVNEAFKPSRLPSKLVEGLTSS